MPEKSYHAGAIDRFLAKDRIFVKNVQLCLVVRGTQVQPYVGEPAEAPASP